MPYESATILFRHGKDDFAVWEVELPKPLLQKARHAQNTATGDLDFILDQLPIQENSADDPRCQFLFADGSAFALFSVDLGAEFYARYQNDGCSVRGSKQDVLAEVEEQLQALAHRWEMAM